MLICFYEQTHALRRGRDAFHRVHSSVAFRAPPRPSPDIRSVNCKNLRKTNRKSHGFLRLVAPSCTWLRKNAPKQKFSCQVQKPQTINEIPAECSAFRTPRSAFE